MCACHCAQANVTRVDAVKELGSKFVAEGHPDEQTIEAQKHVCAKMLHINQYTRTHAHTRAGRECS